MSVEREDAIAALVDATAAGVEGVTRVFPAEPTPARAARQALGGSAVLSVVRRGEDDALVVEVCIGVSGDPADVGRRVSEAVRSALGAHPSTEVRVRISRLR